MTWTIDSDLLGLENKVAVITGGGGGHSEWHEQGA